MSAHASSRGAAKRPCLSIYDTELNDLVLDSVYYAHAIDTSGSNVSCKSGGKYSRVQTVGKAEAPPSVTSVVSRLAADRTNDPIPMHYPSDVVTADHHRKLRDMHSAFAQSLLHAHRAKSKGVVGFTPTCTVDWDNGQLRWGRTGVPFCSASKACIALNLTHAPGPLHAFLLPGQDPSSGSLCLLCTRLHACMINDAVEIIDPLGEAKLLLPPFNNLVNCPGGYHGSALGVGPDTQRAYDRQVAIVGGSPRLTVRHSPLTDTWWVDQGELVWQPTPPPSFLGQGAADRLI